jgi:hypothetical protein
MSGKQAGPKPLYPDTPWWASLVAVLVTAVVSVMGTAYALGAVSPGAGSVPGPPGVASLVRDTITYIPHIMLLFGVLADMFTYEGVYSIPSLVGILSIFGNWILRYFWRGIGTILEKTAVIAKSQPVAPPTRGGAAAPVPTGPSFFKDYDGCTVQGFSSFASPYAPQTLVVTATVFMYYIFDNVTNRGWLNALAGILIFGAVFLGQAFVVKQCPITPGEPSFTMTQQVLMSLVEGLLMGGLSFSAVAAYSPSRLPSSAISPFPRKDRSELTLNPDGKYVDENGIPYVILPNGQTAPDLSSMESRATMASLAGENLGTGAPAMPGNCSS